MKVINYISEAFEELRLNVTWTKWNEVQKYAIIVAIFSILFSIATWGVDLGFSKTITQFFNWINNS